MSPPTLDCTLLCPPLTLLAVRVWCEVEHASLCVSGVCLLWLLCSVASGLYAGRVCAPSVYCADLNRWLRLFGLEWRVGSGAAGELRGLSGAALHRRARKEKDKFAAAERERERIQATVEAEAERNRLHFLELLEREETLDGDNSSSSSSGVAGRSSPIITLPRATDSRKRRVQQQTTVTDSDSPQQSEAES